MNDYALYQAAERRRAEAESARNFAARQRAQCRCRGQGDSALWVTLEREAQGEMTREARLLAVLESDGALG